MANSSVCYTVGNNFVESSNQYFPCGNSDIDGASAQTCCYAGDYCMANSICYYTRAGVTNGTGYYMAGCTDSTWQDPACPKQCTSEFDQSIIYDQTNTDWRCCDSSEDSLNCQEPSEFIVEAPGPDNLSTLTQVSTAAPTNLLTTSIGIITSPNAGATTSPNTAVTHTTKDQASHTTHTPATESSSSPFGNPGKGLSHGAQAGLATAMALAMILFITAFFFLLRKIKRRRPNFERYDSADKSRSAYSLPSAFASRIPAALPTKRDSAPALNRVSTALPDVAQGPKSAVLEAAFANRKSIASSNNRHSGAPSTRSTARRSATPSYIQKARKSAVGPSKLRTSSAMSLRRDSESASRDDLDAIIEAPKERFSWEHDAEPYEMQSQESLHSLHRVPYERQNSSHELDVEQKHSQDLPSIKIDMVDD